MALDMNGIKNENEFFTTHYIAAMLEGDLEPVVKGWKEAAEASARPTPARRLLEWGRLWLKEARTDPRAAFADELLPGLLEALGYAPARPCARWGKNACGWRRRSAAAVARRNCGPWPSARRTRASGTRWNAPCH